MTGRGETGAASEWSDTNNQTPSEIVADTLSVAMGSTSSYQGTLPVYQGPLQRQEPGENCKNSDRRHAAFIEYKHVSLKIEWSDPSDDSPPSEIDDPVGVPGETTLLIPGAPSVQEEAHNNNGPVERSWNCDRPRLTFLVVISGMLLLVISASVIFDYIFD